MILIGVITGCFLGIRASIVQDLTLEGVAVATVLITLTLGMIVFPLAVKKHEKAKQQARR
jgi:hypothetical protein